MSIIGQQDNSNLYNGAENVKATVVNVGTAIQQVINAIAVLQGLPAYNGSSSAGDKTFINSLNTTATSILNSINSINWPF